MRSWARLLPAAVAVAAVVTIAGATASFADGYQADGHHSAGYNGAGPNYYVSLGDSLAVGLQPDQNGVGQPTNQGYVDDVFAHLTASQTDDSTLQLVKFGCSGETSTTLINGGICTYPNASSQLDAATRFLAAHRGHVQLVTFDIGSNDLLPCVGATSIDTTCVQQSLAKLATNLTSITASLHKADPDAGTRFVGLDYYDPELPSWLQGASGQALATQSVDIVNQFNQVLINSFDQAGYRVADVAGAFQIKAFSPTVTLPGFGDVPLNVATACQLTWLCVAPPVGPNIHPNAAGYTAIAQAVEAVL